jgi:hypothetical protein
VAQVPSFARKATVTFCGDGLREGWRKSQVLREKQRSLFVGWTEGTVLSQVFGRRKISESLAQTSLSQVFAKFFLLPKFSESLAQGGLSQNTSPFAPQRTFVCKQQTFVWKQQTFVCNSKRSSATANVRLQQRTFVCNSKRTCRGSIKAATFRCVSLLAAPSLLEPVSFNS